MERELTLTDIAGYLPYKLRLYLTRCGRISTANIWNLQGAILTHFKPVLRPMSDLYKEITHKGETFVPIVELAKLAGLSKFEVVEEECDHTFSVGISQYICDDYEAYDFKWSADRCSFVLTEEDSNNALEEYGNYRLFDLLHQLKFDYRGLIDAGLAISVHDLEQNPYEK